MDFKKLLPIIVVIIAVAILALVAVILFFNPQIFSQGEDTIEKKDIRFTESFDFLTGVTDTSEYQLSNKIANTPVKYPLTRAYVIKDLKEVDLYSLIKKFDFTDEDREFNFYQWSNNDSMISYTSENRFLSYSNLTRSGFDLDFKNQDSKATALEAIENLFELNNSLWTCELAEKSDLGDLVNCYMMVHEEKVYAEPALSPMATFQFAKNGNLLNATIYLVDLARTERKEMPTGYTPTYLLGSRQLYKKVIRIPGKGVDASEENLDTSPLDGGIEYDAKPVYAPSEMTIDTYEIVPYYFAEGNAIVDSVVFKTKDNDGEVHYVIVPYLEASDMTVK